jgi:hypothetical protein
MRYTTGGTCPCPSSLRIGNASYYHADPRASTSVCLTCTVTPITIDRTILEQPIHKGDGQYRTTIGFIDVVVTYSFFEHRSGSYLRHAYKPDTYLRTATPPDPVPASWQSLPPSSLAHRRAMMIEVKITLTSLGQLLRQIKLYREYADLAAVAPHGDWVVATRAPLMADDVAALAREGITHVRLRPRFEAYMAASAACEPTDTSPEI